MNLSHVFLKLLFSGEPDKPKKKKKDGEHPTKCYQLFVFLCFSLFLLIVDFSLSYLVFLMRSGFLRKLFQWEFLEKPVFLSFNQVHERKHIFFFLE